MGKQGQRRYGWTNPPQTEEKRGQGPGSGNVHSDAS